ncbi:MAG: Na+/H+ antiporter NhaC family protein [Planctomycetota bacterium]
MLVLADSEHPYGWLSLAPPLATVVLAIVTKRALVSLLLGLFAGALILTDGDPGRAVIETCETHLWPTLTSPDKIRVFAFTLTMGAMIGVVNRGGGMFGLVGLLSPLARDRRSGQLTAWFAGLIVFFDDYTNTQMLGATMRSTCDRLRISREKLAYIVDSTAAPVAGIALISTWVAIEIAYIQDGLNASGPELAGDQTAAGIFLSCIPYRFYIIQALLFVPLVALIGRDFGPMRRAEQEALDCDTDPAESEGPAVAATHWINAAAPLLLTLAVVVTLIIATGRAACEAADPLMEQSVRNVFGAANSALALFYGALAGLLLAIAIVVGRKILSFEQAADGAFTGVRAVLPALAILWFASAMSGMTRGNGGDQVDTPYPYASSKLYTGDYLQSLLPVGEDGQASPALAAALPTVVFLLASVVAFSTGTSFGTMGILLPVVTPVVLASVGPGAGEAQNLPLMLASFGGVLSGAIFGDHCSPISDTTILSSQSSGCDHVAHVFTQLPYALTVAAVCVALGTAPLALGVSVWLLLPAQTAALAALLYFLGRPAEQAA